VPPVQQLPRVSLIKKAASKMYHGSPAKHGVLKPVKQPGASGKPTAVYGTPRRGLALFFSIPGARWKNLTREKGKWVVHGLSNKQLSTPGHLYHLDPKGFKKYKGWQYISDKEVKPRKLEVVPNVGRALRRHGFKIEKTSAVRQKYNLFPHQAVAVKQLLDNDGVLVMAHGTGTGKTFTSIAGFEVLKKKGKAKKALVVVPTGLRTNYVKGGLEKFTDSSYQIVGSKSEKNRGYKYLDDVGSDKDYTIVGYEMFRQDPVGLMDKTGADTLILDEYHKARDPGSKTWKAALLARQKSRNFIGLTASIVNNDPSEIAPLVRLAKAGRFMNQKQFNRTYKQQVGTQRGFFGGKKKVYRLRNVRDLQNRIGPVLSYLDTEDLRAKDMPRKQTQTINVLMSDEQKALYNYALKKVGPGVAHKIRNNLPLGKKEAFNVFSMILQARQASNSIHTLDKNMSATESAEATPKVKRMLDDAVAHLEATPDGKVVMYSNLITGGVDVLHAGLKARGIPHGIFAGKGREIGGQKVDASTRGSAVKDFQTGKTKVIVLSGAGAEGLDLKDATLFQALDGHFNPERVLQAEARARRLKGQQHRPPEKRVVEIRRYRSVLPTPGFFSSLFGGNKKEFTTDEWIYNTAQRKYALNRMLRNAVRSVALSKPKGEAPKIDLPRQAAQAVIAQTPSPTVARPAGPKPAASPPRLAGRPMVPTTVPSPKMKQPTKYVRKWKDLKGRWRYEYPKGGLRPLAPLARSNQFSS
jgi:hypothetical protein